MANTVYYDVWLGTDPGSLVQVSSLQETLTYDPGALVDDTDYYWRIDQHLASQVVQGEVWTFHTLLRVPEKATNPYPADTETDAPVAATLTWDDGGRAETFDVYFGATEETLVLVSSAQAGTSWDPPGNLAPDTSYAWRIDSSNASGTTTGDVWTFATPPLPGKPINPNPPDEGTDIVITTAMSWEDGGYTDTYSVYVGVTAESLVLVSSHQAAELYQPGASLGYRKWYYWRVDAHNNSGTTTGDVWSFATEAGPVAATPRAIRLPKRLALPDPRNISTFTQEEKRFYSGVEEGTQKLLQILRDALTPGHDWTFGEITVGDTGELITDTKIANWDTAYSWGDHAGLYDPIGSADTAVGTHESTYSHTQPTFARVNIDDTNSYLDTDGSGNMTFTDAVVGSRTLKQLGCPTYKIIKATTQSPGDLHLSGAGWGVSKAVILSVRVVTVSTNWSLWLLQNDNGYAADDAAVPKLRIAREIDGNANLVLDYPYQDEDASNEVHLYYLDEAGADTADIYVIGFELI